MTVNAYAKVNLTLDVTGKRADGYHELETIMHSISLCDVVTVEKAHDIILSCDNGNVPLDGRNICIKCARAFFEKTGTAGGCHIHIEKHIPMEAGLGGGSTDGAAVLCALDALYGTGLGKAGLADIGAHIGADIPFCIYGGCAVCRGIGEIIEPMPAFDEHILVAKGAAGISTASAYALIDALPPRSRGTEGKLFHGIALYNVFEQVENVPDVGFLREFMLRSGADHAMMTGSGSAVFGIYEDTALMSAAAKALEEKGYFVSECRLRSD
ncbi:MAG: 4-(cytidine 5'-diphospho)-2-C-methyl-D-erythritol kinase [Oscillospiraceae bacterium]|nr:4-(cytidine 5'-diphospho)-2-C-methyl-D-erythritol kinase [Oscillospiraceae bacterium]